ncbi:putative transaldolase [Paenibacillus cisolokensis]|uniref:Transaldolase n=1 Tax=Paenibacillus cisolokensis TaxID=1658519 RepID=A0ABQ4NCA8_9BACL|nr:fructose-6-phosphate aldolase [Paenibacillus cisolokensis]GIQ65825.1 putative transaldolase [Paenibacillus cisolokensis]
MEFYIDTADLAQIKEAMSWGILEGVTTNPSIVAREKRGFEELIREIARETPGKVWCEVIGTDADTMVEEARMFRNWADRVVVKLPMGAEGVKAASRLSKEGIETNMTLVYSVGQAVLAAKAGVRYVSPYLGRVDDVAWSGATLIGGIVETFARLGLPTKVIAASVRGPQQVLDMLNLGVHAVTTSYSVWAAMMKHPMTDIGLEGFLRDWKEAGL